MLFDVQRLLSLDRVSAFAISPRGEWAAVAVTRYDTDQGKFVSSIWRVPFDRPNSASPLTRGTHNDRAPAFRRDGTLCFISNRKRTAKEDDARDQVWALPAEGGEPIPITDEPLGVSSFRVAKRGDRIVVIADVLPNVAPQDQRARAKEIEDKGPSALRYTSGQVRHWDHWLGLAAPHVIAYEERGGGRRDLTPNADREYRGDLEWDLSEDGGTVAIVERTLAKDRCQDSAIRLIDTRTGSSKLLGVGDNLMFDHPRLSPSGRSVACTHQVRSRSAHGKISLAVLSAETGAARIAGVSWDRWPMPQAFTSETTLLVTAEEDGQSPVFSMDLSNDQITRVTAASAKGSHQAIVVHEKLVFGLRHSVTAPPELFRAQLGTETIPQIVSELSGFSKEEADAVVVTEMRVPSTDGVPIHTYVVAPRGVTKPPVLIWIHGGPVGAFGDLWHWRWNAMVMAARGYAVALPNPRGSTGYGQAHVEGIWGNKWGAQCYEDVMSVADALTKRADLDGSRMAAMGGSFGGYMSNWIGGHTTRFLALVTHASIYHFEAFAGATDYPAYFQLDLDANPRANLEALNRHSPHRFVKNWKTPTLIIHGEKDYRVPVHEALLLFDALQDLGVESELMIFPDENHWISKPRNIEAWYEAAGRFLDTHVKAK